MRAYGAEFLRTHPTSRAQRRVLRAIARCRTAALGGHRDVCDDCGQPRITYNSCRNRHCPKCQGAQRAKWLAAEQALLLPVPYFHVIFTLPHQLNPLLRTNQRRLYALLFASAAATLQHFARTRRGVELGITMVLHTWGQTLTEHVHVHCVVTGGGLTLDRTRWKSLVRKGRRPFLFSVKALSQHFRRTYLAGLERLRTRQQLVFVGDSAPLAETAQWEALTAALQDAQLGRLRQAAVRQPRAGAEVSQPLHPPGGHLQRAAHLRGRRPSALRVHRLRAPAHPQGDDPLGRRVPAPLPAPRRPLRLHAHPPLRHSRQLHAPPEVGALPRVAARAASGRCPRSPPDDSGDATPSRCPRCGGPMRVVEILAPQRDDTS